MLKQKNNNNISDMDILLSVCLKSSKDTKS